MYVQDHKETPPSAGGHEGHGVHVCHKCGWPFPNPHPSAKHRRAHKRVCGKVEGYKIIDSETDHISDDDHLSDDDNMKTPSPKAEKESVKELGSSDGIGLKSIKSEDDVFSDAVTEFSDSGITPIIEERLEKVRQLDKSEGEDLVNELNDSQLSEDHGTDDTTRQPDDFITGRGISNAEAVGSVINPLVSTKPISDNRVEEASFAVPQTDGQQINSSISMFETISEDINANAQSGKQKETISSKPETNIVVKESVNEVESLTESVAVLSISAGEAPLSESKLEEADRKVSDAMTMEYKLQEADGNISHAMAGDKIVECEKEPSKKSEAEMKKFSTVVEQKKELSNVLQHEMSKHNLSPQVEHLKCIDASVSTQVEANSAKDAVRVGREELAEVYDLKEGEGKEADIILVSETLPALENPEIITGDFKDNEVLRSSFPLDVVDAEVNRSVEDENKVNPNVASSVAVGSLGTSHSYFNSLDDSLEKEGVLASVGGEIDVSGLTVISGDGSGTNGLKGSPGTSGFETQKSQPNYSIEGFQPDSADEESSRDGVSAPSSIERPDIMRAVSSVDEETCRQMPNLSKFETSDDTATMKSNHVMKENGTNHSFDEDKTSKSKRCTDEVYVETSHGIQIGKSTEVQRSGGAVGVDPDFSPEGHSITSGDQQRSMAAVSQLEPEDHGVVSEKDSRDSEEAAALFVTSTISNQSTATVEDKITRDAVTSELLPDEGDGKLTKGSLNVSAVDSSQTESLDGNLGSVSVLSTQSDGTALPDAQTLSSAGTQAPEKSEGTFLNPQTYAQECHPDKPEDSEPPSFTTLIESGIGDEKKVAASEIHDVQKTEQPKSEALQASWFPSLTNVVNESDGRKKNKEIIAKVTNWSTGKQHSPLKNLLSEAQAETKVKSISQKQDPPENQGNETASKNNGAVVTTVNAIIGSETPGDNTVKREMEKEWNSPARYPVEIKKEKRKGKPYWVPFVCCTSVHQNM